MVKEKKLTKSSIAIIVLALLLVASLIMGMTGAWFTDKADGQTSRTLTFGQIDVDLTSNLEANAEATWGHALPGDHEEFNATLNVPANMEGMFVLVKVQSTIATPDGKEDLNNLYVDDELEDKILPISFAATGKTDNTKETASTWLEVTKTGSVALADGEKLYYVPAAAAAQALYFEGSLVFDQNTTNVAYKAGAEPEADPIAVRLNLAQSSIASAYTVTISIAANAIQARNIGAESSTLTAAQWDAVLGALHTAATITVAE